MAVSHGDIPFRSDLRRGGIDSNAGQAIRGRRDALDTPPVAGDEENPITSEALNHTRPAHFDVTLTVRADAGLGPD